MVHLPHRILGEWGLKSCFSHGNALLNSWMVNVAGCQGSHGTNWKLSASWSFARHSENSWCSLLSKGLPLPRPDWTGCKNRNEILLGDRFMNSAVRCCFVHGKLLFLSRWLQLVEAKSSWPNLYICAQAGQEERHLKDMSFAILSLSTNNMHVCVKCNENLRCVTGGRCTTGDGAAAHRTAPPGSASWQAFNFLPRTW